MCLSVCVYVPALRSHEENGRMGLACVHSVRANWLNRCGSRSSTECACGERGRWVTGVSRDSHVTHPPHPHPKNPQHPLVLFWGHATARCWGRGGVGAGAGQTGTLPSSDWQGVAMQVPIGMSWLHVEDGPMMGESPGLVRHWRESPTCQITCSSHPRFALWCTNQHTLPQCCAGAYPTAEQHLAP